MKEIMQSAPRFIFFTGKGGVGKTSVSCMLATALAAHGLNELKYFKEVQSSAAGRVAIFPWMADQGEKMVLSGAEESIFNPTLQ
ncbi:MAG: ArsA-related P-loop ATPase [Desulfobacterales bacterium]|nr:ArsA-related P-loop ATPase [Desulfobacterales bacterium]